MKVGELFRRLFMPVPGPETIALTDVEGWLNRKEEEARAQAGRREERTRRFLVEISERIAVLESVSLDERKADPRIKAITEGNLRKYIDHLKRLDPDNLLDFYRKSTKNYERATLLVGKELGDTKTIVADFARFMERHKDHEAPIRARIRANLERLEDATPIRKRIAALQTAIRAETRREKQEKEALERRNEKANEERAAYERDRAAMRSNILKLKGMIDFKRLSAAFHATAQMARVKEYRERFETAVEDDGTLLALLDEAKLSTTGIAALLATIRAQRRALRPPTITEERPLPSSAAKELAKEERLLAKAGQERQERIESIRKELLTLGIRLEDET